MPTPSPSYSNLIVVHYHLRPGGVRRIIELALPHINSAAPHSLQSITLATGEAPDEAWREALTRSLPRVDVHFVCEPAFRYLSEQRSSATSIRSKVISALEDLVGQFAPATTLIWAQNLGLGRNLILSDELAKLSARHRLALLSHHHDLWFENRWARWREMRTCGFRSLSAVARASFAAKARACHLTINRLDYAVLTKHLGPQARCLPNLAERRRRPSRTRIREARNWLTTELGHDGPVWIFPTRFLRRKNLAEAVLLTRWLRPEGLVCHHRRCQFAGREDLCPTFGDRRAAREMESSFPDSRWKGILAAD